MRDIKYILKRILIGVGIALVLSFLRGGFVLQAHAQTIGSYSIGEQIDVINNNNNLVYYNISGAPWANYGDGYLVFDFSVFKVAGSATSPNVMPSYVRVNSGNVPFVCSVGSSSVENSTFNNLIFSAFCPVHLNSSGVSSISIGFQNNQQNSTSDARVYFNGLLTFEQKVADTDIDYNSILGTINANANANSQYTQEAINNASSSITNNQNNNTQSIINNQNSNTQQEIESQKVCTYIDKKNIVTTQHFLNVSGDEISYSGYGITDYLKINNSSTIYPLSVNINNANYCFYNVNKTLISCHLNNTMVLNQPITIPNNSSYVRFTIKTSTNEPQLNLCNNGNQAIFYSQQDINNSINDSNVSSATSDASSFFGNFSQNSHGLSGIITAPLRLIQSLSTASCVPLEFDLPFVGNHVLLPCMRGIYENYFGVFFSLWQLITTGLISYNICINLYSKVRNLQNPNNDRIEVLNL